MLALLAQLKHENVISELSYQFAKLIARQQQNVSYAESQQHLAVLLAALLAHHVAQGHTCLELTSSHATNLFGLADKDATLHQQILQKVGNTPPLVWQQCLQGHIAFSDESTRPAPMLFQGDKLYFYRYWQAENHITRRIQQALRTSPEHSDCPLHKTILDRFFRASSGSERDWQKIAVATALKQPFCVISGGPGTGKTRTVAILLCALQLKQLEKGDKPLNIALVAPTGKAAARLKESMATSLAKLALPQSLTDHLPSQASTIHSLIGIRPDSEEPRFHFQNPLPFDLLVVDEASMIDLFVMEKLLNAIKPTSRVVMLGDKDQLASVEAGNIMAEFGKFLTLGYSPTHSDYLAQTTGERIPAKNATVPTICDSLCHLRKSFRFDEHSGIGRLAAEINAQQAVRSWQQFANPAFHDLNLVRYPDSQTFADKSQWTQHCVRVVVDHAVNLYRDYLHAVQQRQRDPHTIGIRDIFHRFQQVRFLSALRVSELGVERLNQSIAEALQRQGVVQFRHSRESYLGKPILITENVPALQIFSGDIGIILPDEQGKLRAYFETEIDGKSHHISLSRLPNHEPAYVMTVHKSQGSEFTHTLFVLPLHSSPVLSKELLYTAVTRAKNAFTLFGSESIWKQGVKNQNQRQSGLMSQLFNLSK